MTEIFQNIREIYDFTLPCGELDSYIEFFSESSSEKCDMYFAKGHDKVIMFRSWTPTFYINLTGPYRIFLNNICHNINAVEDILILRNNKVVRYNHPNDRIFTVKFYPGGLEHLLGLNVTAGGDEVIFLNRILSKKLLQNMRNASNFQERVNLIEKFLLESFLQKTTKDHYIKIVQSAIGEYQNSGMQLNTSQLAEREFITSKTINRYFNRVAGISPKTYFTTLRARAALTAMVSDPNIFSPIDFGYYDPAHFYKDIFNFTGQKLKDLNF